MALAIACIASPALAAPASGDAAALDARTHALAEQLRCMVCQNQTLADSNAELAVDLRNQIREQLHQGASEGEIRDFLVSRYGDFVLYKPPLKPSTWALWFGPVLLLAGIVAAMSGGWRGRGGWRGPWRRYRHSGQPPDRHPHPRQDPPEPDDDLAPDERQRLARLLDRAPEIRR